MKEGWEIKTLNQISENLDSKRVPVTKRIRNAGNVPYYGASGIVDYVEDFLFDEDLLLISEDGANLLARTYPIAYSISGKSWVNNHAHVLKFSNSITQKFVEIYLNSLKIDDFVSGMAQPKLNQTMLNKIQIPIPPFSEQKRIVLILDEAFASIAKTKANAEQNLKNAKELFESYLHNVFANTGNGWRMERLEDCFKLKSGDALTSRMMCSKGAYPVYGGNGIAGLHDKYNLSGSNVIIGRVGALCGNVRHLTEKIWLTDNAFKIVDLKYEFDFSFLTYLLNYKNLRSFARQAAQPVISNSSLKDIILQFPEDISKQQSIVYTLQALSTEVRKLESTYEQKLNNLDEFKKSMLQKAFSGELN